MYIKHGYVASRNILVTHHGMVKLVDFAQAIIFEKERVAPGGIDGEMEAVEALLLRKLEVTSNTSAAGIP
jgi:RIO-like serine/threonine protein kinase